MASSDGLTVWERLREYATTQPGSFTSQEVVSWFRRHAPSDATDQTVRTHLRGACWNVGDRSQFAHKEPFLTRLDRGIFRWATSDEIEQWRAEQPGQPPPEDHLTVPVATAAEPHAESSEEWHTEANVQRSLVASLVAEGWRILSVANTATKEHGIDVIAVRDGQKVGIEVKGFPSRDYADPARANEVKRTRPSTQAGHWYSQALLAAMRLRGKQPAWRSVIALPDFPRYHDLHAETVGSLEAAQIEVWWVDQTGSVHRP